MGQGAETPALTGTRAAGAFSGELPSGRARRPAPPRPSPARTGHRPSLPTSYCLSSSQQLHSMVLCSAPAALATTGFRSVASGWIWSGASTRSL